MEEKELLKLEKENNKLNKLNDKAENKRIKENIIMLNSIRSKYTFIIS